MHSLTLLLSLGAATSVLAAPSPVTPATRPSFERRVLDLGHLGSRGGPVETLPDGTLLWVTTEPEAPWTSPAMWSITRVALRRSTDGGRSWSEPQILRRGSKDYSVLSHGLKRTVRGALVHIFTHYSGYDYATGSPDKSSNVALVHRSEDGGRTWSEPEPLPTGVRYVGDTLSIETLRDGRIIYPFAYLTNVRSQFACSVLYSDDDGRTWRRSPSVLEAGGGGFESGASEPTVVELPDGTLWMLIRAQTGFLWESWSHDRGETWSKAVPSRLPSSNAPATARRLRDGSIAVAWNNHIHSNYARQSLVLGLTRDGRTFDALREIDFTDFPDNDAEPALHVTYPYLTETGDGRLAVSYNKGHWMRHNRPALALVDPAWLLARNETVDFHEGRIDWHTTNPGPERAAAVQKYVATEGSGEPALEISRAPETTGPAGIVRNIPLVSNGEIVLSMRLVRPEAHVLFGESLLNPGNVGEAVVRIRFSDGQAWLAAGSPQRQQNNRRTTEFHYLSHAIGNETPYPAPVAPGEPLRISVRYASAPRTATVRINDGPPVELATADILGLGYVGFAASGNGALQLQSIRIALD